MNLITVHGALRIFSGARVMNIYFNLRVYI